MNAPLCTDQCLTAEEAEINRRRDAARAEIAAAVAGGQPREVWIPERAFPNDVVYAYTFAHDVPKEIMGEATGRVRRFREVCDE